MSEERVLHIEGIPTEKQRAFFDSNFMCNISISCLVAMFDIGTWNFRSVLI